MTTMKDIHKGTIVKMSREPMTGASYLEIDDVDKGPILIVCQGTPTAKGFNTVFPGTIVNGKFNNDAIAGKEIFYLLDPHGVFKSFLPIDQATPEEIEEFEQSRKETSPPPKETGMGRVIMVGSLPPDHPIYSRGPMIFGRPHPPKKTSPSENN